MPSMLLSAKVFLCERVLVEFDKTASLIRLVDVFYVHQDPTVTPPQELAPLLTTLVVTCSFQHDDEAEHLLAFKLKRPDGSEKTAEFQEMLLRFSFAGVKSTIEGIPKGHLFAVPWGIRPTHLGLHELILLIDGERVASSFFTLTREQRFLQANK